MFVDTQMIVLHGHESSKPAMFCWKLALVFWHAKYETFKCKFNSMSEYNLIWNI